MVGRAGSSSRTPERLLETTEALLAERDERGITVRDIATRAGANVAAVGYHFGSKDDLVLAVFRRVIDRVTAERRAALEALPRDADLEGLVRAWLAPALAALDGDAGHGADWRVLSRSFLAGGPAIARVLAEERPDVERALHERLATLVPHLPPAELAWRHAATLGLAGFLASGGAALLAGTQDRAGDHFVAYVVGGLTAPAARRAGSRT